MAVMETGSGPIAIEQINSTSYVWAGSGVAYESAQEAVDAVRTLYGYGEIVLTHGHTYTDDISAVTGGTVGIFILDSRGLKDQRYVWDGNEFVPQPTVDLGDLIVEGNTTLNSVDGTDATFDTCSVANSPVRTFDNSPDTGGMVWPTSGIPVSLGDHWQTPSINPATLVPYPAAGVPVSTGTAWSTPIDPATLPRLDGAGNFPFTGPWMQVNNSFYAGGTSYFGLAGSWATTIQPNGTINASLINVAQSVTAPFYRVTATESGPWPEATGFADFETATSSTRVFSKSANANLGQIQFAGATSDAAARFLIYLWLGETAGAGTAAAQFRIPVTSTGGITLTGVPQLPASPATTSWAQVGVAANNLPIVQMNCSSAPANSRQWLQFVDPNGTLAFLTLDDASLNSAPWLQAFRTGLVTTNTVITGDLTASGAKNFRITHPLDDSKFLTHSCIEGPEIAVFYRGEGVTKKGVATITLPDYFEALTRKEGRTVQLTEIYEDDSEAVIGSNQFAMLMASRVKDGKFSVRSSEPIAKFYWEVKAQRAEVEPLAVITDKQETEQQPHKATPHPHPRQKAKAKTKPQPPQRSKAIKTKKKAKR